MTQKITVTMPVAVHPIQAKLWQAIEAKQIATTMSFREIADIIADPDQPVGSLPIHPQQIKHHLDQLVKKGTISLKNGTYHW